MMACTRFASFIFGLIAVGASSASAQQPARTVDESRVQAVAESAAIEEVVVTGSRIARTGFETATPVTAISASELDAKAMVSMVDIIDELPSMRPNINRAGAIATNVAISTFDIRSLGSIRALTLVNGRRVMDTSPTGGFDINVLPAPLINRMEIVTGGASSVYGSDAVTGVVNVFIDTEFEGVSGDFQLGISNYGDREQYSANLAYGTGFASGRGHFVAAGSVYRSPDLLFVGARSWGRAGWAIISNPDFVPNSGEHRQLIAENSHLTTLTFGGLIVEPGPLQDIEFREGGRQHDYQRGHTAGAVWMIGGDGPLTQPNHAVLAPDLSRSNFFSTVTYDLSSTTEAFAEVLYAENSGSLPNVPNYSFSNIVIQRDNAFLPDNIAQVMDANDMTSFRMARLNPELGVNDNATYNDYWRVVTGLSGDISDWTWDAYVTYSHNDYYNESHNNRNEANWAQALDAVTGPDGRPVCRSTLMDPDNGCVPANVFGFDAITPAAVDYIAGTSWMGSALEEVNVAANVQGELFSTWAGPVGVAGGIEYRDTSLDFTSDPISHINGWRQASSAPYQGSVQVTEGAVEATIPLLDDESFAGDLDLDLAARVVNYSTSGTTTVWKAGVNWRPSDQVRFRSTYSRDFRGPKLDELFAASTVRGGANVFDPFTNSSTITSGRTGGNPNLKPEESYTITAGVVLTPHFIPRFRLSLDVYDIDVEDAISFVGAQEVIDRCFQGEEQFCDSVFRNDAGVIELVETITFNAQVLKTRGLDLEAVYAFPASSLVESWNGDFTVTGLATYVDSLIQVVNQVPVDRAGQLGGAGVPHWRAATNLYYDVGPWSVRMLGNFIGGGKYNNTYTPEDIDKNDFSSRFYVDTSVQFELNENFTLYGKIENLLNTDPPIMPSGTLIRAHPAGNTTFHDLYGRTYYTGMRFRF